MLRDITLLAQGLTPTRLFDLVQELVISVQAHKDYIEQAELQHARATRDLVAHFLAVVDNDDPALRDGIVAGLSDLQDHVARMEEHAEH